MKPLPQARYELAEWKDATVNIDYHVRATGVGLCTAAALASEE